MKNSFKLNLSKEVKLNLSDLEKYIIELNKYKNKLPIVAGKAVKKVSEEGIKNNYESTEVIPIEISKEKVTGGIIDKDKKDKFREYGTGLVGSNNPQVSEELIRSGWKYDINSHGEAGWVYKDEAGNYWRTKGQPAQKKFYEASKKMEEELPKILKEELEKMGGE